MDDEAPEPWDVPLARRHRLVVEKSLIERPFRPSSPTQVPPRSLATLEQACGPIGLDRLLVVPSCVRPIGGGDYAIAPGRVLAFGDEVVACWIDSTDGLVLSVPIRDLAAFDDRTVLLYGRLRLVGMTSTLVVRYNTVARDDLQQNLGRLRTQMAVRSYPVEPRVVCIDARRSRPGFEDLPYRWRFLFESTALRPNPEEAVALAAGDLSPIDGGKERRPGGIAILGPRELVIATEPSDWSGPDRYGVDLLAVPRERLESLGWDGRDLTVRIAGIAAGRPNEIVMPLEPLLVDAIKEAFAGAVAWH